MTEFHSRVVGVTARNPDGMDRQDYIQTYCKPNMRLILKREPDNPHDPNAVGVWIKARALLIFTSEVQIGHLSRDVAEQVADHMDSGGRVKARIVKVTGGTRKKTTCGVNILLTLQ